MNPQHQDHIKLHLLLNAAIQWYFWLGPQFQVETLAKSAKHANNVFLGITKKKGGMMDPGRCRVMFDHRGQIIAKPPQSAGYSTDIAEEDAIEIGMLTKNKNHFAFAGPITNAKNAVSSSYAFLRRPFKTFISP